MAKMKELLAVAFAATLAVATIGGTVSAAAQPGGGGGKIKTIGGNGGRIDVKGGDGGRINKARCKAKKMTVRQCVLAQIRKR